MLKTFDGLTLLAYCSLIFWLSDQQTLPMPSTFEFQDKFLHAGAYWVMGVLSWRAFRHFGMPALTLSIVSLLFCSLYGVSDEWHQSFVPGRESSAADWLADSFGAAMAMLMLLRFKPVQGLNG